MSTTLKILKLNPVESGIAHDSREPYEWHTAECALLDAGGKVSSVGRMTFPKTLRETLGGVPPVGIYRAVIAFVALGGKRTGQIGPQVVDLISITG